MKSTKRQNQSKIPARIHNNCSVFLNEKRVYGQTLYSCPIQWLAQSKIKDPQHELWNKNHKFLVCFLPSLALPLSRLCFAAKERYLINHQFTGKKKSITFNFPIRSGQETNMFVRNHIRISTSDKKIVFFLLFSK
jgi:hypothetical protein